MGGGGGGNTTTTTSGVPEWLRPDVQRAFGKATAAHDSGALSQVAQFAPGQTEFLADTSTGGLNRATDRALTNLAGKQLAGQAGSGTLGSARGDRAREAALADVASQNAQADFQARNQAFDKIQAQKQANLDAGHQGLQRLFGYYGSGAAGQTSESSQGGGK